MPVTAPVRSRAQSVLEVATTGDLRDLFAPHAAPAHRLIADLALRRSKIEYYKPIEPQTPIDGEHVHCGACLHSKKVGDAIVARANGRRRSEVKTARAQPQRARLRAAALRPTLGPNGRRRPYRRGACAAS